MIKKLISIVALVGFVAAMGQVLPDDGQTLTMYGISERVGEMGTGDICDLSNAVTEDAVEMTFKYYGDTLVSRTCGLRKDWYEVRGDTVWSLGYNTRQEMQRYHRGMPYLILSGTDSCSVADSLRHVSFLIFDRQENSSAEYSSAPGCGFIFNTGDTIMTTYCVRTVSADSLFTVCHQRWYADHCVWPVAEQLHIVGPDDYQASELYICPPAEQRTAIAKARNATETKEYAYNMLSQWRHQEPQIAATTMPHFDIINYCCPIKIKFDIYDPVSA